MVRRVLIGLAVLVGLLILGFVWIQRPEPEGETGPEADTLARDMMAAVRISGWEKVGYVSWDFGGRQRHQWDRKRGLSRVRWGDIDVTFRIGTQEGVAHRAGQRLDGAEAAELVAQASRHWNNDAFWLNPLDKLFDPGTSRHLVRREDGDGLLVRYSAGGDTPGDAYLWILGEDGRPTEWRMWVSIIPVAGLSASWEGWQEVSTGAWIATRHGIGPLTLELTDVVAVEHWSSVHSEDPFSALFPI